jgi:hypothetical protein
MLQPDF